LEADMPTQASQWWGPYLFALLAWWCLLQSGAGGASLRQIQPALSLPSAIESRIAGLAAHGRSAPPTERTPRERAVVEQAQALDWLRHVYR
jgi:hypothetical protein